LYDVVGVRFKKAGKIYYFDPGDLSIQKDEFVIVETVRGVEYGRVVTPRKQVGEKDVVLPLKKVVRIADQKDRLIVEENKTAAKEAYDVCSEKVNEHQLDMKLVDVEYTFDRNKVIFYFTADGRVDFRELVKDLASIFRTRIELRQIGVRDEAKMLGGIGPCGRMLCCSTFLGDFDPVSIKMAKDQNLSLNPTKISGLCGRLMCCLKYENDEYETAKEQLPDLGEMIVTPNGPGKVVGLNILGRVMQVDVAGQERVLEYTLEEIQEAGAVSLQSSTD
jgi:cell fate regulator YaaT (PSP1 superfamily)